MLLRNKISLQKKALLHKMCFLLLQTCQLRKTYRNEVQNQTRQTQHTDSKLLINGETKNTFRKDQRSFEKEQQ